MNYLVCEECGRNEGIELHHVIFKSQSPCMANIEINFKYLCYKCHRGNNGPHLNRVKDLEYKYKLQNKLFEKFSSKAYYTEEEIRKLLKISKGEASKILKKLKVYKEGYCKIELIQRLMGGRIYAK